MSTVSTSNASQAGAILSSLQSQMASLEPDNGYGYEGERPPQGVCDNYLVGMNIQDSTFTKADKTKIPSVRVTFEYRLIKDATHDKELEWKGESFNLPMGGFEALPNGDKGSAESLTRWFAERDQKRLRGHIETILGRPMTNIVSDLQAVRELVGGASMVSLQVKCDYRPNKKDPARPYFAEYLQKNLATA